MDDVLVRVTVVIVAERVVWLIVLVLVLLTILVVLLLVEVKLAVAEVKLVVVDAATLHIENHQMKTSVQMFHPVLSQSIFHKRENKVGRRVCMMHGSIIGIYPQTIAKWSWINN